MSSGRFSTRSRRPSKIRSRRAKSCTLICMRRVRMELISTESEVATGGPALRVSHPTTRLRSYGDALREALQQEMQRDNRVFLMGQGIDDFKGFYGTTLGLADDFGSERVFDTPLAEESMTGVAIGAALAGLRPVHMHIRMDFLLLAM